MSLETPVAVPDTTPPRPRKAPATRSDSGALNKPRGTVATVIMAVLALVWLFPMLWALLNSFRSYAYTQANGYLSFGGWTLDNYRDAWERGSFAKYFVNSLYITVPAVLLTLFLASLVAFVLSNYMKALPPELYESAQVDGASVFRQWWQITLPLCRPALAALATLEVTWIYNEFFWATALLQTGSKFPVTSSLNNLKGQFFVDYNLLSAGSVLVALPPILVFFILQKQFVSGLTLGATKG